MHNLRYPFTRLWRALELGQRQRGNPHHKRHCDELTVPGCALRLSEAAAVRGVGPKTDTLRWSRTTPDPDSPAVSGHRGIGVRNAAGRRLVTSRASGPGAIALPDGCGKLA